MTIYISRTELLKRPYWSKSLIKKLLQEADNIQYSSNGNVRCYEFSLERVEVAENTSAFHDEKNIAIQRAEDEVNRINEIELGFIKALEIDIKNMEIPKQGGFSEALSFCRDQMTMTNSMMKVLPIEYQCSYDLNLVDTDFEIGGWCTFPRKVH